MACDDDAKANPLQGGARGVEGMVTLENYMHESGLDHSLIDVVKTRASQGTPET
jgi:hypothetical protein